MKMQPNLNLAVPLAIQTMQSRTNLLTVALFLSIASTVFAQTGSVAGTVQDATGGFVPHAQVTFRNVGTDATRSAATGTTGVYSVPELAAGKYDITIAAPGFQNQEFRGVTLTVGQNLTLNGTLAVGATSQSIEVQGDAVPTVDTEDAQISNLVDARRIENLPLITRDPYSLVALSNGVQKTTGLGGFAVNGQRERNNNFQLDGLDNNDAGVPGAPSGMSSINPDSAQEFRVITNNFLPEYGRNTGAIIDVITRSGTNSFHGNAYEFHRDRDLAARDYFNTTPDPQNPFVYNDFGASLGGPIQKDKAFFFVNAEWQRVRQSLDNETTVPTAAFKSGVFNFNGESINLSSPTSPNNVLGLSLDPQTQKILAAFPNPSGPLIDGARGIYNFSTSLPSNSASTTVRLDRSFGEKLNFYARYVYNGSDNPNSTAETLPGVGGVASTGQTHNLSAGLTYLVSPTLTNEFRAGVNRGDAVFTCNGISTINKFSTPDPFGAGSDYGFETAFGQSTIGDLECGALGDSNGQAERDGTWDIRNNATWVHGNHTIKGGFEFRYVFDLSYDDFFPARR